MSIVTQSMCEQMKEHIEKLDTVEHAQILNIIKKYTDTYTNTSTGVLVSTEHLNNQCLLEINGYLTFLIDQRKHVDEYNKSRKTYERMIQ